VVHRIQQLLGAGGAGDGLNIKRKTRHLNRLRRGPVQCTVCLCTTAGVVGWRMALHLRRSTPSNDNRALSRCFQ
jgi:hypothetical protein